MKLPEHLMIPDCDGNLYDTRTPNWSASPPLREKYRYVHREIKTTAELKATLRVGYAWPGGYEIVFFTSDGALLCGDCVKKELRNVLFAIRGKCADGWRVVGCGMEATSPEDLDPDLISYCDHCNKEFGEIT